MFLLVFFVSLLSTICCEFCGANKIPFGLEVHKDGRANLLCSKPNCFDKKYAECDERAIHLSGCPSNSSWVGGFQRSIDGDKFYTLCCEYPLLLKYGELLYEKVIVRRGEFFEGEEKTNEEEDVTEFDLITDMKHGHDEKGEFYKLTIHRYFCGRIPDSDPIWAQKNPWPKMKVKQINW